MQNGVKHSKIPHTTPFCAGVSKECHLPSIFLIFRTLYISIFSCVLCFLDFRENRSFYKKVYS